jgi:hypothetical protein
MVGARGLFGLAILLRPGPSLNLLVATPYALIFDVLLAATSISPWNALRAR